MSCEYEHEQGYNKHGIIYIYMCVYVIILLYYRDSTSMNEVEGNILQSNPLLEAFGKLVHNYFHIGCDLIYIYIYILAYMMYTSLNDYLQLYFCISCTLFMNTMLQLI